MEIFGKGERDMNQQINGPLGSIDEQLLIKVCQELLQIPSYTGEEQEAAEFLVKTMLTLGYDSVWVDGVGNVIGEIRGGSPGCKIVFDGHIDTIPVSGSEIWYHDPFEGLVEEGRIYGRGAVGMKGALAAMICGLAPLVQHKDKLAGSIFVSGTVGKEQFEGLAFRQVIQVVKPDYVIIGEASGLNICHGQRGRAQIIVMTTGKAVHSATPLAGKNATYMMMDLVHEIRRQTVLTTDSLGQGNLELINIASAPVPANSTVPHQCWATFDRYLVQEETEEDILAPIYQAIEILREQDDSFTAEVGIAQSGLECYTGQYLPGKRFFPAWLADPKQELVQESLAALSQAGFTPELSTYKICTNGSYSAAMANVPTIGFGPGREQDIHIADENLELSQLVAAAAGYQAIACQFLLNK
jgi:putative selenium metabolism hydrolase